MVKGVQTGRLFVGLLGLACWILVSGSPAMAAEQPVFKLGFAVLAALIPDVTGIPVEMEHSGFNGDSMQQTTTGLMVWRKADNWTAFTDGYRTWVNGPLGLQVRTNDQRFDWEAPAPAPTPTQPTPTPSQVVGSTPSPTSTASPLPPAPAVRARQINVLQGQGLQSDSVWILGELHNDGAVPAYNIVVTAKLLSDAGAVVLSNTASYTYLGPGDVVGFLVEVRNPLPLPFARADVSVAAGPTSFATFVRLPIAWVQNIQLIDSNVGKRFEFTGILNNNGPGSASLNAIYVWFLDDSGRVVWADTTYITSPLDPGGGFTFVVRTPWDKQNPAVTSVTQVRFYAAGQLR